MRSERANWDRKYRAGWHKEREPDPFLVQAYQDFIEPLFPRGGAALDVAGGAGRHALWLAERGWQVTLADISPVGLARARANAGKCADRIEYCSLDLKKFKAGRERYDLVLVFFYLERTIFPELVRALRPGGLLLYKTYTREQPGVGRGPRHPSHLLKESELLRAFSGLRVLHYRETIRARTVAEFVGRKP